MKKYNRLNNPYTLQFSFIPPQFIERAGITSEIMENFIRDVPTYRGIFITGVRGSGKTVMLGDIRNRISKLKNWITIDLNPESDLLNSLAHMLYQIPDIKPLFVGAKLDLSALGIGVGFEKTDYIAANEDDALCKMLTIMKKKGKKLLITIDEVTYSKDVARFSHALSSYAGRDLDVYVLMTGLKENIDSIKNEKSLTFLYRAKNYKLETLNIMAISLDYQKTLSIDGKLAVDLANMTMGYPLAFQAVGYHCWNAKCTDDDHDIDHLIKNIEMELDISLSELAYDKIWDGLSSKDREILAAIGELSARTGRELVKVEDVRKKTGISSDTFTRYRKRLIDSGIVEGKTYGHLRIALPRFCEYIMNKEEDRYGYQDQNDRLLRYEINELSSDNKKRLLAYIDKLKK